MRNSTQSVELDVQAAIVVTAAAEESGELTLLRTMADGLDPIGRVALPQLKQDFTLVDGHEE